MQADEHYPANNNPEKPAVLDRIRQWRLERRRNKKYEIAPHLYFENPNDIDKYTCTDLRAIGAFYLEAASHELSGKVMMPDQSKNLQENWIEND